MCKSVILFVLFYYLFLYCFILLLWNLAQEFPSGLIKFYLLILFIARFLITHVAEMVKGNVLRSKKM